jgi:hypothetical protein
MFMVLDMLIALSSSLSSVYVPQKYVQILCQSRKEKKDKCDSFREVIKRVAY